MRGPRTREPRVQDVHDDDSDALDEARATFYGPHASVERERSRDGAQVAATGTRDLGTMKRKAIQGTRADGFRYTVAQTGDN